MKKNMAPGANHHGTFQIRVDPDGSKMVGKWIGFDKRGDIQHGDWNWERVEK